MTGPEQVVFLVDVDNTLPDNDRVYELSMVEDKLPILTAREKNWANRVTTA